MTKNTIEFDQLLTQEVKSAILAERIAALAAEGYQHQLNLDFIVEKLGDEDLDYETSRVLTTERDEILNKVNDIKDTIEWHLDKSNNITR